MVSIPSLIRLFDFSIPFYVGSGSKSNSWDSCSFGFTTLLGMKWTYNSHVRQTKAENHLPWGFWTSASSAWACWPSWWAWRGSVAGQWRPHAYRWTSSPAHGPVWTSYRFQQRKRLWILLVGRLSTLWLVHYGLIGFYCGFPSLIRYHFPRFWWAFSEKEKKPRRKSILTFLCATKLILVSEHSVTLCNV